MIRVSVLVRVVSTFALVGCASRPAYQAGNMRDLANQRAAQCKQNPALEMCKQASSDESSGSPSSPAASTASSSEGGTFTLSNDGCEGNPDYIVEDATGTRQTGLAQNNQEMSVQKWPATVCLTKDHNTCMTNKARVTATGQKVTASSCHHVSTTK